MPFQDLITFAEWSFSNLLWGALQALVLSIIGIITARYGFKFNWISTLGIAGMLFVFPLSLLLAVGADNYVPKLNPRLLGVIFDGTVDKSPDTKVLLVADVTNAGRMASSIISFGAEAIVNGKKFVGRPVDLPDYTNLKIDDKVVTYLKSDSFYEKISRKIDTGDHVSGILMIEFPGVTKNDLKFGAVEIKLDVVDVLSRASSSKINLRSNVTPNFLTFPGLSPLVR